MRTQQHGRTLVELLVVIGIISALATMTAVTCLKMRRTADHWLGQVQITGSESPRPQKAFHP